jgi:hypothetical protein
MLTKLSRRWSRGMLWSDLQPEHVGLCVRLIGDSPTAFAACSHLALNGRDTQTVAAWLATCWKE